MSVEVDTVARVMPAPIVVVPDQPVALVPLKVGLPDTALASWAMVTSGAVLSCNTVALSAAEFRLLTAFVDVGTGVQLHPVVVTGLAIVVAAVRVETPAMCEHN